MIVFILWSAFYLIGFFVAGWMMRVEHIAEHKVMTKGAHMLSILLSVLSWLVVLVLAFQAWYDKVDRTGYWSTPVEDEKPPIIINQETK